MNISSEEMINYHEIFRHYCDLNEIAYHSSRDKVIDYMIGHPYGSIEYHTPYVRLFALMHQYIAGIIDLETMMMSGEINHPLQISLGQTTSSSCIVVDSILTNISCSLNQTMIVII